MVDLLIPILVALVPVIIAVIGARLYGVLHGIITYLFMGQLLMFCLTVFGANLGADLLEGITAHSVLHTKINDFVVSTLSDFGLDSLIAGPTGIYVILGAFFLVFLISQLIGGAIRKHRIAKIKGRR